MTPFAGNLRPKSSFLAFHEEVLFFKSKSDPVPLPHKEGLCGAELFSCREEGRVEMVSLLHRVLEGYGWTMSAVGGK